MLKLVYNSIDYRKMMASTAPLCTSLGINHFWYYNIQSDGYYYYLGTHQAWSEYCFAKNLTSQFPCLDLSKMPPIGIQLMKHSSNEKYNQVLRTAWEKFSINFSLNLVKHNQAGVEAFGFALSHQQTNSDELLLNEIPLLSLFIQHFRQTYHKTFKLLEESKFKITNKNHDHHNHASIHRKEREKLLAALCLLPAEKLTVREKQVSHYIANGYSSRYIANQLELSKRTVENYTDTIKGKLNCFSKDQLISKISRLKAIGYLADDEDGDLWPPY